MKNIHISLISLFIFVSLNSPVHGEEVWGAWFPAPSPDGKMISFSYYGDIWIVDANGGRAERLTVSEGYESRSLWSPDGKWIAFQTDRWGNEDVCVMRADGSEPPKRLTYYSTYDALYNWTPDGKSVVFVSPRTTLRPALYRVSMDGGLPKPITHFSAWHVCFTPDGKTLFYERGQTPWWRRKYRGGANEEIWVKTLPDGKSVRITDHPGRDGYPMYSPIDKKLYFLGDRGEGSVSNIWRMDTDGQNPEQVTYETEDIHFPEISLDGSLIAYESSGYIYTCNTRTNEKKQLAITISEDYKENPFIFKTFTSNASEFALSPDEKEIAFVVHGDIFVMALKDNRPDKVVQVTNTPYMEKYVSWHPQKDRNTAPAMKQTIPRFFMLFPLYQS